MHVLLRLGAGVNIKNNRGWTPLHAACRKGNVDSAAVLLRWGADETIVTNSGKSCSQYIPDIALANDQDRPRLEHLTKLLAQAPQDRAWRRRGFLIMCRAYRGRIRLVVEVHDTGDEGVGHPWERPSCRVRRRQMKVEVGLDGAHADKAGARGARSSNGGHSRRRSGGVGGGFDGVAAWLMVMTAEDVFRKIVGFL